MRASAIQQLSASTGHGEPQIVTLLELVNAVCDVTDDDVEVVSTVLSLLRSGRVRLGGNFRGVDVREFA